MYGMGPDMLKQLYVKGSLKNEGEGFAFEIKNTIDSGSISGLTKISVDGNDLPIEGVTVTLGGKTREAKDVTWSSSLYVGYGAVLKIWVPGALSTGEHTITMQVNIPELGRMSLPVTDTVA